MGRTILALVGGFAALAYGAAIIFPLVAPGSSSEAPPLRRNCLAIAGLTDGAPGILGSSTLTSSELLAWWEATDRGQPSRLSVGIDELIELYTSEADAEGVRADLAFAQAVLETGHFNNSDTSINNFAGIGHYDDADSGIEFPDAPTGVRAQIQLLKRYVLGNDTELAGKSVAPDAGASAVTWEELAGTWASDEAYWDSLSVVYANMLDHAGHEVRWAGDTVGCQ